MSLVAREIAYAYVSKQFALRGVSLAVDPGQVLFLLGANGSGKTTLLECLCGVRIPQAGEIEVDGVALSPLPPRERARRVAYVPQFAEVAFAYTAEEMVLFGRAPHLGPFGRPTRKDYDKALEAMAAVGIEKLRGRPVNALSGGERRLVLIARGLAQEAPYLLLDEPDAHLDPANQHRVLAVVRALAKNGLGVVATTHNPNAALLYGQTVLLLREGKTMVAGDPHRVLSPQILAEAYGIPFRVLADGAGTKAFIPFVETG